MSDLLLQWEGQLYNTAEMVAKIRRHSNLLADSTIEAIVLAGYELYGPDVVKHMKGSFAFCIRDRKKEILHLYRDRLGSVNVYYCIVNGTLVYSTNLGKILSSS